MAQIIDTTPDDYHRLPGLSSSIAKVLIAKSPLHAKVARERKPTKIMDRGAIIHRLTLGKGKDYISVDAKDWRTKAAQAARDEAREQGLVPVLADDLVDYTIAAGKIREQLEARGFALDGESEVAVGWQEASGCGPVDCRAMFDHVWMSQGRILDLKITGDASPSFIERNAESLGYAIQAAAYRSALTALRPDLAGRVEFLFAFCEPEEPYAINVCRPDGAFREIGERRWGRAVTRWAECLKTDTWPGYGAGVNHISPPAWALNREDFAA